MIRIDTLGSVVLTVDGSAAPRPLTWRKNLALLVYLARSPGRQRSREHLVGLLWGDKPDGAARHSLNEALSAIRRSGGGDVISTDGDRVQLAYDGVVLDVDELQERFEAEDWSAAAALANGTFLEGFALPGASRFEDWLGAEQSSWRQRSVDALVHQAENALLTGDLGSALIAAERAATLDPVSNAAVRARMQVLALRGERGAALEVYNRFVARLDEEFGVEPESETVRLADRVRRERTWRLPAALAREPGTSRRVPLVGRERQLRAALDTWRRSVDESRSAAVLIQGDPGTGRTRLIEEIVARVRLEGAVVAGIRAVAADRENPWSGVFGLARGGLLDAPGLPAASPRALASFGARESSWRDRFSLEIQNIQPALPADALSDVASAVVEEQPLVLFVDDAEWLDDESAGSLIVSLRDLGSSAFLLVLALPRHDMPEPFDELRAHLGRDVAGETIQLQAIPRNDICLLARHLLPTFEDEQIDRLARRVEADSAGLPLFAVEILNAVRLGLELGESAAGWPQRFKTLDQTLPGELPDSVVGSIRVGFRRLSPEARQVLCAASVLGERVPVDTLELATGLSVESLLQALDELEWERWLVSEPRGYGFLARIVGEVVERDMLTPGQRHRIREAVGAEPRDRA